MAACSFAVDADAPQCATTSECEARGASFQGTICEGGYCRAPDGAAGAAGGGGAGGGPSTLPAAWSCLEDGTTPPAPPAEVSVALAFSSLSDRTPFAGLRVNVCRRLDLTCSSPLTTLLTDARGRAEFRVPTAPELDGVPPGFSGYLEVMQEAPAGAGGGGGGAGGGGETGLVPSLIFFRPPIVADAVEPPYLVLTPFRRDEFTSLVELSAGAYDATRGHIIVAARGCDLRPAAGVHLSLDRQDAGVVGFYAIGGFPATAARQTDPTGYGGFVKVPVDFMTVAGSVWDDGAGAPLAPIADAQVQTRPDWITYTSLGPAAARQP